MIILGIDPGHTTGVAFLKRDDTTLAETWATFTLNYPTLASVLILEDWLEPKAVVIERLPATSDIILNDVSGKLRIYFPKAVYVGPGEWKPVMRPYWRGLDKNLTRHERDALSIAKFHSVKV